MLAMWIKIVAVLRGLFFGSITVAAIILSLVAGRREFARWQDARLATRAAEVTEWQASSIRKVPAFVRTRCEDGALYYRLGITKGRDDGGDFDSLRREIRSVDVRLRDGDGLLVMSFNVQLEKFTLVVNEKVDVDTTTSLYADGAGECNAKRYLRARSAEFVWFLK